MTGVRRPLDHVFEFCRQIKPLMGLRRAIQIDKVLELS